MPILEKNLEKCLIKGTFLSMIESGSIEKAQVESDYIYFEDKKHRPNLSNG